MMRHTPFLGQVRLLGQADRYSWNRSAQPIGQEYAPPSRAGVELPQAEAPAAEAAPAGESDVACYHCSNPEMFGYLSQAQAKQWNAQYNRHCIKVPESNCKPGAAAYQRPRIPTLPFGSLFSGRTAYGGPLA